MKSWGRVINLIIVSIHAPARGATCHHLMRLTCCNVSIHAPARGATYSSMLLYSLYSGFNPRPCARGDYAINNYSQIDSVVSIHAPARGATISLSSFYYSYNVSIHAPARGATEGKRMKFETFISFNPRPCARGDFETHPTWTLLVSFNPRPCARGDERWFGNIKNCIWFQSTPLREGRRLEYLPLFCH
mgnify:CR=1 FL=1